MAGSGRVAACCVHGFESSAPFPAAPKPTFLHPAHHNRTPAQRDTLAAVQRLQAAGAQRLVLDLRDNRGGLVSEGIEVRA